jgi:hypothetical protein
LSWLYEKQGKPHQVYECAKRSQECAHGSLGYLELYLRAMLKHARYDKSAAILELMTKKNKMELHHLNDEYLVQETLKILSVA